MLSRLLKSFVLAFAVLAACSQASFAEDAATDVFAQKLKSYDPEAVEAARSYARTFNFKNIMEKSVPALTQAATRQIKAKNPELTDQQINGFVEAFLKTALVDSAPVLEEASILMMLDIFNKDELIALDKFYSSPVGASIVKKIPIMMGRMPELMQTMQAQVFPRAFAAARDQMKQNGVDVKI
jgi:hypothetical protein